MIAHLPWTESRPARDHLSVHGHRTQAGTEQDGPRTATACPGPAFSVAMALRAYSRARSTASRGVATGTNNLASTPALSMGHVRRPNTVLPRSKAWAISLRVPYEPFTAMIASAVRTMMRFRAVLIAVAIGRSM